MHERDGAVDVEPRPGRLVVFLSGAVWHQVRPWQRLSFCYTLSPSLTRHLLKVEGGASGAAVAEPKQHRAAHRADGVLPLEVPLWV